MLLKLLHGIKISTDKGGGLDFDTDNRRWNIGEIWLLEKIQFRDVTQKAKVTWSVEASERSLFFMV